VYTDVDDLTSVEFTFKLDAAIDWKLTTSCANV